MQIKILKIYGEYINKSTTIHMTSPILGDLGYKFDQDLAQEIRKEIISCIPTLRSLIKKEINAEQHVIVIVAL